VIKFVLYLGELSLKGIAEGAHLGLDFEFVLIMPFCRFQFFYVSENSFYDYDCSSVAIEDLVKGLHYRL